MRMYLFWELSRFTLYVRKGSSRGKNRLTVVYWCLKNVVKA